MTRLPFALVATHASSMLGEQSHGDGTAFLLKTRLIKYLHERRGFDVILFESGLYDTKKAWERLVGRENAVTAVRSGVFSIWSNSQQVQPLIDYLGAQAKTAHPLELAGFDSQLTGSAAAESWVKDLMSFLNAHRVDTAAVPDWPNARVLLDSLVTPPGFARGPPWTAPYHFTGLK